MAIEERGRPRDNSEGVKINTCNLCGEQCGHENAPNMGLVNAKVCGGYFSTPGNGDGALDDMTLYTFSMCEFCLDWLFCQFKTPPQTNEYHMDGSTGTAEVFRPAKQRVQEDVWRRYKEDFFREFHHRSAARGKKE